MAVVGEEISSPAAVRSEEATPITGTEKARPTVVDLAAVVNPTTGSLYSLLPHLAPPLLALTVRGKKRVEGGEAEEDRLAARVRSRGR
jgi:hypothetical protein